MSRLLRCAIAQAAVGCSLVTGTSQADSIAAPEPTGAASRAMSDLPDAQIAQAPADRKQVSGTESEAPVSAPLILCGLVAVGAIALCFYLCARWTRTDKAAGPSQ